MKEGCRKYLCVSKCAPARLLLALAVVVIACAPGLAQVKERPRSFSLQDKSQDQVELKTLPKMNIDALIAEDKARDKNPQHPGPMRFAVSAKVSYTLTNSGTWQNLPDGRLWRLRIQSPGATSMDLGITRFEMPQGAKLWVYDPAQGTVNGSYTSANRTPRGSLWTPVVPGDTIVVEVFVPTGVSQPVIEITVVNQGYRGFGKGGLFPGQAEGTCNNDEICPIGDPYRAVQIQAVAMYTIGTGASEAACTGTLLNDVPQDHRNYFLSANHCLDGGGDPSTIVLYWNFESPTCGTHGPGSLADTQTGGATLRANWANSDFALFELNSTPDAAYNVHYSGWDATGVAPAGTAVIHHPSTDVKAVSTADTAPQPADWTGTGDGGMLDPAGNHWQADYNSGVTERGSSGSCLFDSTTKRCIGQLHGGPSACGSPIPGPTQHDYYGMFSVSWNGGGTSATRLKDWLDPASTGTLTNDGDPHITTANGVHYNFQGAGEYVALRNSSGLEIQTRESPIATTFNPGPDPYDNVATCVSLNTAVAARVGKHRVTYEPNLSGVPDPSGMQLRIDGTLTTLGSSGQDLGNGGHIRKTSFPGGLEIDFPDSNVLYVTPGWWNDQGKWFLDVDVVHGPAIDGSGGVEIQAKAAVVTGGPGGLMADISAGSWLPALPDGSTVGPMPAATHDRYVTLYQQFGNSWRVTDRDSLFDYAPGTSTGTFTMASWPPENPPCTLPNVKPAQPATLEVAENACRKVTGANAHADCVFDVRVTGFTGFATIYLGGQTVLGGGTAGGGTGGTGGTGGSGGIGVLAGRLAAFLDLGGGIPNGTFGNFFNTGLSFNAGLEYIANSHFSVEGIFGYHHFPAKLGGNLDIYQFVGDGKAYLTPPASKLRPFVNAGLGGYKLSPGSTSFGGNFGGGLLYQLTSRFGLQVSYNFHVVNTPGFQTRFSTIQGGVRIVF